MANQVYANNMEISCKSADGKSVACFPDACFTPPWVPIPYPNIGMAKDTTNGSWTVKISGKEVMLKDKSYFKISTGDEAGNAPKKGVVTSKIKGKVYFTVWSMDVKFEGGNVVRHFDLMTHNHASKPGNTPPWAYADAMATAPSDRRTPKRRTAKWPVAIAKPATTSLKPMALLSQELAAKLLSLSSPITTKKRTMHMYGSTLAFNHQSTLHAKRRQAGEGRHRTSRRPDLPVLRR